MFKNYYYFYFRGKCLLGKDFIFEKLSWRIWLSVFNGSRQEFEILFGVNFHKRNKNLEIAKIREINKTSKILYFNNLYFFFLKFLKLILLFYFWFKFKLSDQILFSFFRIYIISNFFKLIKDINFEIAHNVLDQVSPFLFSSTYFACNLLEATTIEEWTLFLPKADYFRLNMP